MRGIRSLCVTVTLLLVATGAQAQTTTVDFESLTEGSQAATQVSGVTFTNAQVLQSQVSLNEAEFPPHSGNKVVCDVGGPMTVAFSRKVTSFSGFFTHSQGITVKAMSGGSVVQQAASGIDNRVGGAGSPNEQLTVASDNGFDSVVITANSTGTSFTLDDMTTQALVAPPPAPPIMSLDKTLLVFDFVTGKAAPSGQTVTVSSTVDVPTTFTVTTSTSWIKVVASRLQTPATVTITVNPAGMDPGSYTGVVVFASNRDTLSLPVTLHVAGRPQLLTVPSSLAFKYTLGGAAPAAQQVYVAALNANIDYYVLTKDPWVKMSPDFGTTGQLDARNAVTVNPAGMAAGHYETAIYVYSVDASNSPLTVPVTLDIAPATSGGGN